MGSDKATLLLRGRPLVEHAVALLRSVFDQVRIVGSRSDLAVYAPIVADMRAGCGPLSGIEAALASSTDYAAFIPVDLPLLTSALLRLMRERVCRTRALCTVPFFQGVCQPLCAVYHRSLLPAITASLDAGDYKVLRAVEQAAISLQPSGAIDRFNVEALLPVSDDRAWPENARSIFLNCNTPSDFARLVQQVH